MDTQKNYYFILGVLPSANIAVIKAAYKALIKIYHPDIFHGSKEESHNRTVEINEAYAVLSNPQSKIDYDKTRKFDDNEFFYNQEYNFEKDEAMDKFINEDWVLACKYCRDLEKSAAMLSEISSSLCFSFKATILESQEFNSSWGVATKMKQEYLERYFGCNKEITHFAEFLIKQKNKEAARELNMVVTKLGANIDVEYLIKSIKKEFSIDDTNHDYHSTSSDEDDVIKSTATIILTTLALLAIYQYIVTI